MQQVVVCDGCGRDDLPTTAWRLARATGRVRSADLCADCEVPVKDILAHAAATSPGRKPSELTVVTMAEVAAAKKAPAKKSARKPRTPKRG